VKPEAAQEFIDGQRHEALFVFVRRVAPAEGDDAVSKSDEPMVRDRHPMGVLAEVAECVLRSAEGAFRVNGELPTEPLRYKVDQVGSLRCGYQLPIVQRAGPGQTGLD